MTPSTLNPCFKGLRAFLPRILLILAFASATVLAADDDGWDKLLKHANICDAVDATIRMELNLGQPKSVTWEVKESYPAPKLQQKLKASLEKDGWKRLDKLVVTQGSQPLNAEGWFEFTEGEGENAVRCFQHVSEWQNEAGEILWCSLAYTTSVKNPGNKDQVKVCLGLFDLKMLEKWKSAHPAPAK